MVEGGTLRDVYPLWGVFDNWTTRVGHGRRRRSCRGICATRGDLPSGARIAARLGEAGEAGRHEVHGDDQQASRGLLQLQHETDELRRAETRARPRSDWRIR